MTVMLLLVVLAVVVVNMTMTEMMITGLSRHGEPGHHAALSAVTARSWPGPAAVQAAVEVSPTGCQTQYISAAPAAQSGGNNADLFTGHRGKAATLYGGLLLTC